jgi:hypothetical protein
MTERGGNFANPFHHAGSARGGAAAATRTVGDPAPPARDVIAAADGRVLDPATATAIPGVHPRSTAYVGPRLLVSGAVDFDTALEVLRSVADSLGWTVDSEHEDPRTAGLRFGVRAVQVRVAPGRATPPPDAWTLLQQARAQLGLDAVRGIALDHVIATARSSMSKPPLAVFADSDDAGPWPVSHIGPAPTRLGQMATRRPVVAILDTNSISHPWLDDVVSTDVTLDGWPIGYRDGADSGEMSGDTRESVAGRGTFIAGVVHQACPDADIVSWEAMRADGTTTESELIASLCQVAELNRRFRDGAPGGHPIDVLSLSMGYYHETPQEPLLDLTLYDVLEDLARHGTLVVCAAGDDATSRPTFPAAFGPWADEAGPVQAIDRDLLPIVAVGALNPNGITGALSSNTGPWVRAHAPGVELISTLPAAVSGPQSMTRATTGGLAREEVDPEDFRGGFGRWSGTSFATPLLAATLARGLQPELESGDDPASAVARAWPLVEEFTDIRR